MNSNDGTSSIQLFANFDSGNMLRYERVTSSMSSQTSTTTTTVTENDPNSNAENSLITNNHPLPKHDIEFNVWTKRDCEGTSKANGNRSWFYFGVKGGYGKCLRFNIMNLNRQARLFEMGMLPVFRTVPGHEKWARIYTRPCWETLNEDFKLSFIHRMADSKLSITYFAFCFPHSYEEMQILLDNNDRLYNSSLAEYHLQHQLSPLNSHSSDIYYHRETLCYSCDGNKIDLLTITSYKGITNEREHHFDAKLFIDPQKITKRPHQFRNKRIFFLSSRVHPGETPAAFVFLGFLDFILKPDDPRARILRDLYVFKLVPMLNPDGVRRGHYRTDQFGINLNRMYLDPDFERHPSIYAAKSLIAYHHVNNCISSQPILSVYDIFKDVMPGDELKRQSICADIKTALAVASNPVVPNRNDGEQPLHAGQFQETMTPRRTHFHQEIIYDSSKTSTPRPIHNAFEELSSQKQVITAENRPFFLERNENGLTSSSLTISTPNGIDMNADQASPYSFHYVNENLEFHRDLYRGDNENDDDEDLQNQIRGNEGSDDEDDAISSAQNNVDNGVHEPKSPHLANPDLLKISPYESGVAYYIDLHGHASKKGCFIYGNHLPDDDQHTDNLLFVKLISLNSPHFDYENCNFTLKNMYMKDKREGLSKEGSGRVALNKHVGLLHSYTLECSYAVGKSCNSIPAAESETHGGRISPPCPFALPPKFTIEHYKDVGKACALAAIDILPGRNPFTRVTQSTFKTLHTLREFLKHQIRQQRNRAGNCRTTLTSGATAAPATTAATRVKQQQYMARVTQTYRMATNTGNSNVVSQQHLSSSFPTAASAPPSTTTVRTLTNNPVGRLPMTTSNTHSSRLKPSFDSRRYANGSTLKRNSQSTAVSTAKIPSALARIEIASPPSARLVLHQQISSPGRLQQQPQQSAPPPQFVLPATASILDPLVMIRTRPPPLPPTSSVRNPIHRNAVSLNALPITSGANMMRGRSHNSTHRFGSTSTRTPRPRQQSLAPYEVQQTQIPFSSVAVVYRQQPNADPAPVFFE